MRFYFLAIILFISQISFAQNRAKIDSLTQVLKSNISDTQKVNTYLKLAYEYQNIDSANTTKYANKAIKLSTQIAYSKGKVKALNKLAEYIAKQGYYQKAEKLCNQAIRISKLSKYEEGEAKSLSGLGIIFNRQGNYNKALECYFKSLRIQEKIGDKLELSIIYHTIGNLYLMQDKNDKALKYYFKALRTKEYLNDKPGKANAYITIGIVYEKQKKYELTDKYYQKALAISTELGNPFSLATIYNNLGMLYKVQEKYDKAIEVSFKSLSYFEKVGIEAYLSYPILTIGEIYVAQENWKLAQTYLEKGLKISEETNNIENIKVASKHLALAEKELGNFQKAYEHHVVFKQMYDSLQNNEQSQKIVRLEMDYGFQQEKDSIQFANKAEKIALREDIEKRKVMQTTTFISLALLGLLLLTLFLFLQSKTKSNKLLRAKSQELKTKHEEISQQAEEIHALNTILEGNLDEATKDILHKNQKLSEYASMNSHETRAPIARILGLINILNTEELDPETSFIIENIHTSMKELDDITVKMNQVLKEGGILKNKTD